MNERTIFMEVLEKDTAEQRAAFLEEVCAGNPALRLRIEALLRSHEQAGSFLGKPVPECLAEQLEKPEVGENTSSENSSAGEVGEVLDFLAPCERRDILGKLDHYNILEMVGRGGMGIVLKAFDEKLHRVVAIKVMAPDLAASGTARQRFIREAQAAAAVSHDHVVTIHGVEEGHRPPYLVMQFIDGVSLQDKLDEEGALDIKEILRLGMQVACGLAAAHKQGLIHRDIKPANMLLENHIERVKITDFGLARAINDASLSQSGLVAGTPQYMSPEQAEGEQVDHRSDLFSLGSVLYAMCTGQPPFRGSTVMSVLKHVCEETPIPIREINSEVPKWLVDVVSRLHAKKPEERYQSAQEVADVLGKYLSEIQMHGQVEAGPAASKPHPRAWLTNLRPSQFFLGAVFILMLSVSLFLVLRSGTEMPSAKNGNADPKTGLADHKKPPDVDPKENRQVKQAPGQGTAPAVVKAAPEDSLGLFVILSREAATEKKYAALADAVKAAQAGDIIEIHGDGPFLTEPLVLNLPLTLRAGQGFKPVILAKTTSQPPAVLLEVRAPLVLEGLEFHNPPGPPGKAISVYGTPLSLANCRFIRSTAWVTESPSCQVRNCQFIANGDILRFTGGDRVELDNNLMTSTSGSGILFHKSILNERLSIEMTRNLQLMPFPINLTVLNLIKDDAKPANPIFEFKTYGNILDAKIAALRFTPGKNLMPTNKPAELLRELVDWHEDHNLYQKGISIDPNKKTINFLEFLDDSKSSEPIQGLTEWERFWGLKATGSLHGPIIYEGGNLHAKLLFEAKNPLPRLEPADFRLSPKSAGYRAGKDGKDLGPDLDLVGPGVAYERWKKTPAYQEWLKKTAPARGNGGGVPSTAAHDAKPAISPPPLQPDSLKPFMVLTSAGQEGKAFDTLADAVLGSANGDIIEIRGNGPFPVESITLTSCRTIRAGQGFRPVLQTRYLESAKDQPLVPLYAKATLILEGLEFQGNGKYYAVKCKEAAIYIANCRFADCMMLAYSSPVCEVRNSQLMLTVSSLFLSMKTRCLLENNILVPILEGGIPLFFSSVDNLKGLELTRNIILNGKGSAIIAHIPLAEGRKLSPCPWQASYNIVGTCNPLAAVITITNFSPSALEPKDLLRQIVAWREEGNVYLKGSHLGAFSGYKYDPELKKSEPFFPLRFQTLAEWNQYWGQHDTGSIQDMVNFQGGDLVLTTPHLYAPDDFRLRPGSPGYRTGPNGKDIGPDIDLVGPGPAYERWKKTPAYQEWLKSTGQVK